MNGSGGTGAVSRLPNGPDGTKRMSGTMTRPLLHLVFGGEVRDPAENVFVDPENLHVVGVFPDYETAHKAWRAASQARVDEAHTKYVIVHLHRLIDPDHPEATRD